MNHNPQSIIRLLATCVSIIAFVTVLGYALNLTRLTNWNNAPESAMAINSALCFVLLSVAVLILSLGRR